MRSAGPAAGVVLLAVAVAGCAAQEETQWELQPTAPAARPMQPAPPSVWTSPTSFSRVVDESRRRREVIRRLERVFETSQP